MRRYLGIALFLLLCTSAFGRQKVQGNCEQGGTTITTSGLSSTQKVQQSFPSCTVTVYQAGTLTLATIYSDNAGTPLANPFTASATDGRWGFYPDTGRYDIQLSGGGIPAPFTFGDVPVGLDAFTGSTTGSGTVIVLQTSPTLITPILGVATGTSLALGGGTPLATTNQTGTGSVAMSNSPTFIGPVLGVATGTSLALGAGTPLATTNQTGTGSIAMSNSPVFVTPSLGVAAATSLAINGATTITGQSGTGGTICMVGGCVFGTNPTFASSSGSGAVALVNNTVLTGATAVTQIAINGATAITAQTGTGSTVMMNNSPVLNGTPSGTGITTTTLKRGNGLAGTYAGANTVYADVDPVNLSYTVTIPVGWKLTATATFSANQLTAITEILFALSDGGTPIQEQDVQPASVNSIVPVSMGTVINGDGASHTIRLQGKTTNAADSWNITDVSATRTVFMVFTLSPSN